MNLVFPVVVAGLVSLAGVGALRAQDSAEAKGQAFVEEAQRSQTGFGDLTVSLRMTLREAGGRTRVREMQVMVLEMKGDGERSLVMLECPADLNGLAVLTHSHVTAPDDQWLYVPSLGRVRRLSASDRSAAFLGSEFTYEDIAAQRPEAYRHRWLKEVVEDDRELVVVERRPLSPGSAYIRHEMWFDRETRRPVRILFFSRDGDHLKTLFFGGYQLYLERFWRATDMRMENHRNGASTRLEWSGMSFRTGLSPADFESRALGRGR